MFTPRTIVTVGEPAIRSRANPRLIMLVFSRLSGFLASQLHQHSWPEDHHIWIGPDVPVGLSSDDFFAGHDPALDAIKALINYAIN